MLIHITCSTSQARISWDKQKSELESKVQQLQVQVSESNERLKKTSSSCAKTLAAKETELSKALKMKKSAEKRLNEFEEKHVTNEEGLKLNDALRALGTMRLQCQEFSDKTDASTSTIKMLESRLAETVAELAQEKSKSAVYEDKLSAAADMQSRLDKAVADASAARVQLAEVSVRLSEAHKQSRLFASQVFDDVEQETNEEEVHQSFAKHFANEGDDEAHEDDVEQEDDEVNDLSSFGSAGRRVSMLEKKVRESDYVIEALRNQLTDVLTANQHAPMSELHALANCEEIEELSRSEIENMLEDARSKCSEATYRADREERLALTMATQRNQLSFALDETTKSLNEVLAAQESYRTKEVTAAVAAKRLKQAVTEANEHSAAIEASQRKAEESKRVAEQVYLQFLCAGFESFFLFFSHLTFFSLIQQQLLKASKELQKANARCDELEKSLVSLVDECSSAREETFASNSSVHEQHYKELCQANATTDTAMRQFKQRADELEVRILDFSSIYCEFHQFNFSFMFYFLYSWS